MEPHSMYTNPINSPMSASSSLPFNPVMQQQAIAILLLIENSQAMSFIWADLRDRYLPSLVTKLGSAGPAVSNKTLVLESLPMQNREVPRQYDVPQNGLCDVRFNHDPCNRLTVGKIWNGIDILASTKFQGQPAARHLIVVAASTPQDDATRANVNPNDGRSPWRSLAHNLAQADIQCHIVLGVNEDMAPLIILFEETLRLQNLVEEPPSFPVDHNRMLFRLSARINNLYSAPVSYPAKSAQNGIPHRSHTYPADTYISTASMKDEESSASVVPPLENPPSLVTQLQQVHGLTKKKVYGVKPARAPFIRDERVRERYRKGTTSLSVSAAAEQLSSSPNGGGRAITRSRAERLVRGSPTEPHPRHPGINRRMSAPDADSLASPTSFSRPSSLSSPTPLDMHMPLQLTSLRPSEADHMPSEPTWLQPHSPIVSSLPPSQLSGDYPGNRWHGDHNLNGAYPATVDVPANPPYMPSAAPKHQRQDSGITRNGLPRNNSHETPSRLTRSSRTVLPEDDEPFIFGDDYVAQTVALFENEVLPSYPNFAAMGEPHRQSSTPSPVMNSLTSPRHSFYISPDQESLPSSPSSYNPGDTYNTPHQAEMGQLSLSLNYTAIESPLSYATTYSPGSNSSLTGWAG